VDLNENLYLEIQQRAKRLRKENVSKANVAKREKLNKELEKYINNILSKIQDTDELIEQKIKLVDLLELSDNDEIVKIGRKYTRKKYPIYIAIRSSLFISDTLLDFILNLEIMGYALASNTDEGFDVMLAIAEILYEEDPKNVNYEYRIDLMKTMLENNGYGHLVVNSKLELNI